MVFKLCLQAPLASCQATACGQSAELLSALDRQRLPSMEGSVVQPALKESERIQKDLDGGPATGCTDVTPWSPRWTSFGNTCASFNHWQDSAAEPAPRFKIVNDLAYKSPTSKHV